MLAAPKFLLRLKAVRKATGGYPVMRRAVVAVIGGTILLIGIALLVLPGPAFIVIPLGLLILATEFVWARRWLHKARRFLKNATKKKPKPGSVRKGLA